jgi:hypothetical protein
VLEDGFIFVCFLDYDLVFIVSCVIQLLSSLPSCLTTKKKRFFFFFKLNFFFSCSHNEGVVTLSLGTYYMSTPKIELQKSNEEINDHELYRKLFFPCDTSTNKHTFFLVT